MSIKLFNLLNILLIVPWHNFYLFSLLEKCPVNSCVISSSRLDAQQSDLVLFKDHFTKPSFSRPTNQLWMMYFLECPLHTQNIRQKNMFNWTSTYRSDSTLGKKTSLFIFDKCITLIKEDRRYKY